MMRRANRMNAMGLVQDPLNQGTISSLTRGKVITTSGKEIIGNIYIPADFKIALDVGTLYLSAGKLRTVTFTDAKGGQGSSDQAGPAGRRCARGGRPNRGRRGREIAERLPPWQRASRQHARQ